MRPHCSYLDDREWPSESSDAALGEEAALACFEARDGGCDQDEPTSRDKADDCEEKIDCALDETLSKRETTAATWRDLVSGH
jgi:hypothetical protein